MEFKIDAFTLVLLGIATGVLLGGLVMWTWGVRSMVTLTVSMMIAAWLNYWWYLRKPPDTSVDWRDEDG